MRVFEKESTLWLANKFEGTVLLFFKTYLDPLGSRRVLKKKKKDTALRVF